MIAMTTAAFALTLRYFSPMYIKDTKDIQLSICNLHFNHPILGYITFKKIASILCSKNNNCLFLSFTNHNKKAIV